MSHHLQFSDNPATAMGVPRQVRLECSCGRIFASLPIERECVFDGDLRDRLHAAGMDSARQHVNQESKRHM